MLDNVCIFYHSESIFRDSVLKAKFLGTIFTERAADDGLGMHRDESDGTQEAIFGKLSRCIIALANKMAHWAAARKKKPDLRARGGHSRRCSSTGLLIGELSDEILMPLSAD